MTNKDLVLDLMRSMGERDALDLRSRSASMDGTALIEEETKIPSWDVNKDYSGWAVGSPVNYDGQVYTLLQPHNASYYPDANPANTPALWSVTHTKNPNFAKPYMSPNGTSGLYMKDEVCIKNDNIWISLQDNNPYPPGEEGTDSFWCVYQETTEPVEPGTDPEEPEVSTVPDYVQPTGAHDAYNTGDRVKFTDGHIYESTIDNNIWSPTDYPAGWTLVE